MDDPDRKAAAPSFNPDVHDDINKMVKKQTQMLNPGIKNTNKQLYGDLKDNYDLDMSMMQFYTTSNSRVTNDQGAYAEYLYGNMYSGKDSGPEGALMRIKDNPRYLLI
jgi:cell fate regulator YaaT (PSP1 superfamily)